MKNEIMSSCEIIANYHQLSHRISPEALNLKAGIFSISLHPPEGLLQALSYIREETTSTG